MKKSTRILLEIYKAKSITSTQLTKIIGRKSTNYVNSLAGCLKSRALVIKTQRHKEYEIRPGLLHKRKENVWSIREKALPRIYRIFESEGESFEEQPNESQSGND